MSNRIFTAHCIVSGRVQGIGYRWFVESTAKGLGLTGWVKNLPDGTVELEAEGEKEKLTELVSLLKNGHSGAYVREIAAEWSDSDKSYYESFEIVY